jgi:ribonuclease HI
MTDTTTRIAELQAELKALKATRKNEFRAVVDKKGKLAVYGVRKYPVRMTKAEWAKVVENADLIKQAVA